MKKNKKNFEARKQEAIKLLGDGKIQEAYELFYELSRENPRDVYVLIGLAQCLSETGAKNDAIEILEIILEEYPSDAQAILWKAQILGENNSIQDAISFLNDKILKGFNDPEGYALLGELYQLDDKIILAIKAFKHALGFNSLLNPRVVKINLANCYSEISNYSEARKIYDKLIADNSNDTIALFNKAILLDKTNDSVGYLKLLTRVVEIDDNYSAAWSCLADLYEELSDKTKAQKCRDKVSKIELGGDND